MQPPRYPDVADRYLCPCYGESQPVLDPPTMVSVPFKIVCLSRMLT